MARVPKSSLWRLLRHEELLGKDLEGGRVELMRHVFLSPRPCGYQKCVRFYDVCTMLLSFQ